MPYFPQNRPDMNGLRHMVLMYGNARTPWREEEILPLAARLDAGGRPAEWLFDSFLFLNTSAASGRHFAADINEGTTMSGEGDYRARCSPAPATRADWDELLEFCLGPQGALATLDRTIAAASAQLGPARPRNAVLMLPYPHVTQEEFGTVPGSPPLDFSTRRQSLARASGARLEALRWMVEEIGTRFRALAPVHVRLLGVYWMFETVYRSWDVDDHWVLKELRKTVSDRGMKMLWIPFWSSYNVHLLDNYRDYYFDLAFLQPNYMFYRRGVSLDRAAEAARERGAGLEMEYYLELDEPIAVGPERHRRFREYLNAGVRLGYMTEAALAHFQGAGALARMRVHDDPVEREFYGDICDFVHGRYRLKP